MEVQSGRTEGVLTFICQGRFDGFGAARVDEVIKGALQDDDRSIVVDLAGVPYLSSAGIRVLLAHRKALKERGGTLVLSRVSDYPSRVLTMAGFQVIFPIYQSLEEAVSACRRSLDDEGLLGDLTGPSVTIGDLTFRVESGIPKTASIRITGDLNDVLHARLDKTNVRTLRFSAANYSLGIGALGEGPDSTLPVLGEMVTLQGSMIWLPTDGNNTPDFFSPAKDTGEVEIYTGFTVVLDGPFYEYLTIESTPPGGITYHELYQAVIAYAKEKKRPFYGVIACAVWGILAGLESAGVKKAPLLVWSPGEGRSIMDPDLFPEWFSLDTEPKYEGDTIVSFGFGVDRTADPGAYDPTVIKAISYTHPAEVQDQTLYLHNHGVIFRNVPWDPSSPFDRKVRTIVTDGEFVDMRHLLDSTRVRKAKIGIAYIGSLVPAAP
ncbi:MAG: STAS domain-containing protein [Methanomicrobiales archaeon]|nr:STAS domain-containing protein [Methanomicrobiales archaeon]